LSITVASRSGVSGTRLRRTGTPADPSAYKRPADWLPLPALALGEQKVVGLHLVGDHDSNFCGISATGAYTVDWGDGTVENFASGTSAFHNFSYATVGGAPTSEGYRQAIVTVTPQGAGNLATVNLCVKHTVPAGLQSYAPGWLDVKAVGANLTGITFVSAGQVARLLRCFEYVGPSNMTNALNMFLGCTGLQTVMGTEWTAKIGSAESMFSGCTILRRIPALDLSKVTNMTSMFSGCRLLRDVPALNTPLLNNLTNTFNQCLSLKQGPDLDTSEVTQLATTFQGCTSLESIPLYDTGKAVNMANFVSGCTKLETIPLLNTAACTNFSSMFQSCQALRLVPALNTAAATNVNRMFTSCLSLATVPLLNTGNVTDFGFMFASCPSLISVPQLNTAKATTFASMFTNCTSLQAIPALNLQGAGNNLVVAGGLASFASGCASLGRVDAVGAQRAIDFTGCRLSSAELNKIYGNLGTANGAQAITVSNNYGNTADDPTIATAKGWTVTG
jgi:hypothetical protein